MRRHSKNAFSAMHFYYSVSTINLLICEFSSDIGVYSQWEFQIQGKVDMIDKQQKGVD